MAEDNIKEFTTNWIVLGLLTFCLISFTITFMYNNNPLGLDDSSSDKITNLSGGLYGNLYTIETDSDFVLNITASTNPEASELGSRDSVASAYKTKDSAIGFFDSMKIFISWIIVGEIGKMLLAVFGGMIGFASIYFIVKWIRNGV
jgi:hypothetical protein